MRGREAGVTATRQMQEPRDCNSQHQQQNKPAPQTWRTDIPVISALPWANLLHATPYTKFTVHDQCRRRSSFPPLISIKVHPAGFGFNPHYGGSGAQPGKH
jgi:hypothetical protein